MNAFIKVLLLGFLVLCCNLTIKAEPLKTISSSEKKIKIINLYELEKEAAEKLSIGALGYVKGGSEDEITLRDNTESFNRKNIIPNGLTGLNEVALKTKLFGIDLASPIILAPMAAHGLVHQEADKDTIKGTRKAGTIMSISTYSSVPIEKIAESAPNAPFFFQLYMSKDNNFNEYIIKKAKEAGAKAIILTIDSGVPGNREADIRNNYEYSVKTPNVTEFYAGKTVTQSEARAMRKLGFSAEDISYIKKISGLPVIVKGIESPEAAKIAIDARADGIWVSNHGGRQLDGAPSTFNMLPHIAKVVQKRVPIIFDSGVRRGSHVFKALANGADIVAIGRPALYGLALGGADGVYSVFQHLNEELETVMILAGTENVEAVKNNHLFDPNKP